MCRLQERPETQSPAWARHGWRSGLLCLLLVACVAQRQPLLAEGAALPVAPVPRDVSVVPATAPPPVVTAALQPTSQEASMAVLPALFTALPGADVASSTSAAAPIAPAATAVAEGAAPAEPQAVAGQTSVTPPSAATGVPAVATLAGAVVPVQESPGLPLWLWLLLAGSGVLAMLLFGRLRRRRARQLPSPMAEGTALPATEETPEPSLVTAPLPAPQPAAAMPMPARAPLPSDPPAPVAARQWTRSSVSLALVQYWQADEGECQIWDECMGQPAVDFTAGRLCLREPIEPPVATDAVQAAPVAAPVQARVQPAPPAGASVATASPLLDEVQALLDEALGAGAVIVEPMPGTELPQLPVGQANIGLAELQALDDSLAAVRDTRFVRWMRVQLLLTSGFAPLHGSAQASFDAAMALTGLDDADAGDANAAHWQALRLRVQLAWLQRSGPAACLLGLARLRDTHAQLSARAELPVLLAWREVLHCWAGLQQGGAALSRYTEAEALCTAVGELPGHAHRGQQLLAETLLLRSRQELGGLRDSTLRRAAELAQAVLAQQACPALSLTAANVALARAQQMSGDAAAALYEQALQHAFEASADPALQAGALQCRLAIQLAYEALVGGPEASPVALGLADRLQGATVLAGETWRRIVELQLRNGHFEQACVLAAQAAAQQRSDPQLLALWEQASAAWQAQRPQGALHHAWQENVRARWVASLHS